MNTQTPTEGLSAAPEEGVGFYPEFHALWHLQALGVVQDFADVSHGAWGAVDPERRVRVVVMDTPVDWGHPNLIGAINTDLMRDFSSVNAGAPMTGAEGTAEAVIYGAHGTAVAGLIGARPSRVVLQLPQRADDTALPPEKRRREVDLPYAGINPFCEIVPVALTAAPDTEMVLAALRYVETLDADIVVVAAAWDDTPRALADEHSFDPNAPKWSQVEAALQRVARKATVLCAAGNSGPGLMAYPACLAGRVDGLIAVTACDAHGALLTYAYDPKGQAQVIRTLSTQGPRYDRVQALLDPWAERDASLKLPGNTTAFPAERILSLDPRGPRGYNPSPYRYTPPPDGPHLEIGSLYAAFSGTSAATAIAAGLLSLALQSPQAKAARPGPEDNAMMPGALFDLAQAKALSAARLSGRAR